MKHEYTDSELAELKNIYDEQGEAGLSITGMRALRKAGLLTQGLPAKPEEPSKRDLILAHCQNASTKANRSTARKPPKRSA